MKRGFEFARSAKYDLAATPSPENAACYFEQHAPERLALPPRHNKNPVSEQMFVKHHHAPDGYGNTPGVSHVRFTRLSKPHERAIVVCDMRNGSVLLLSLGPQHHEMTLLVIPNPVYAEPVDLDQDGFMDLLVADLGSLVPDDHHNGQVVWLRRDPALEGYRPIALADWGAWPTFKRQTSNRMPIST